MLSQKKCYYSPDTMQKLFWGMCRQVGLDSANSHSGRKIFTAKLIDVGIALENIQKLI